MRQGVERNVATPRIGRLVRLAITATSPADRHASGALEADTAGLVGIDEVEHRHRPVAQRRTERVPIAGAANGDGRAHVVEVLLADPAQGERRGIGRVDGRHDVVDDRPAHGCALGVLHRRLSAHLDFDDALVERPPGVAVAVQIRVVGWTFRGTGRASTRRCW